MRILVVTLYAGENEFGRMRDALARQDGVAVEHLVIRDLPEKQAHTRLYAAIMARRDDFDLAVKLDADMVLSRNSALAEVCGVFRDTPDLDHAVFAVADWFSRAPIMGVHAFSPRCVWEANEDELFVDHDPHFPGGNAVCWGPPAPFVDHCPDPAPLQAYHFGVHRALKAVQAGAAQVNSTQTVLQWETLCLTWEHFAETRDTRLGLAMIGADEVLHGLHGAAAVDYVCDGLRDGFAAYADWPGDDIHRLLRGRWANPEFRKLMLLEALRAGREAPAATGGEGA
jgi:hypothetical protein